MGNSNKFREISNTFSDNSTISRFFSYKFFIFSNKHMGDGKFLRILRSYANGEGYGTEYARFVFADYYEEWEEDYFGKEGIAYYIDRPAVEEDEEIILDYPTFYRYLRDDCVRYLENYPQDKSEVEEQLERIKERFNIQEP